MEEKTAAAIEKDAAELVSRLQPRSGKFRKISPEMDPLRLGSGWSIEDLDKPQVIIESTAGDSHPGSAGLFELVEEVRAGVGEAGGHGARYFCTDICDGEAQGHDGINYSLPSRDAIANMIEIHAKATPSTPASLWPAATRACPPTSWPWAASTSPRSWSPAASWTRAPAFSPWSSWAPSAPGTSAARLATKS